MFTFCSPYHLTNKSTYILGYPIWQWHFMTFYDIYHMTWDVIKYGNMGIKRSVLIRQSDLSCRKALDKNKIWSKIQKTKNKIFPLYFWPKCFVNLILKCWYLKWLRFKRNFLCSLYTHRHKLSISNFREYLKFLFFNTP